MIQGFKMQNLVGEYKTIFLKRLDKALKSPKRSSLNLSFLQSCFEVCQKPKVYPLSYGILVEDFKMPNLVDEYKTIFLRKRGKQ